MLGAFPFEAEGRKLEDMEGTTMDIAKQMSRETQVYRATEGTHEQKQAAADATRPQRANTETITLSRDDWNFVRGALLLKASTTRDPKQKERGVRIYEELVNQGAEQATDKHMAEWKARNERAGVQAVVDAHFTL